MSLRFVIVISCVERVLALHFGLLRCIAKWTDTGDAQTDAYGLTAAGSRL